MPATSSTYRDILRVTEFRVLLASLALLLLGENIRMLVLAVVVYDRTQSALLAALAYVVGFLPYLVGGGMLLYIADTVSPRTLMVTVDLARAAAVGLLAFDVLPVAVMLSVVFAAGLLSPVDLACRNALLADVLAGDAYVLGCSAMSVIAGLAQISGTAVGGILLATMGIDGAFATCSACHALSAIVVRCMFVPRSPRATKDPKRGTIRATWSANRRLLTDGDYVAMLLARCLPVAFVVAAESLLVPYLTGAGLASSAGAVFTALAAGAMAGDLIMGRLVRPAWRERLTLPLVVLTGLPLLGFAFAPRAALTALLVCCSAVGLAYALGLASRFLEVIPETLRAQGLGLAASGLVAGQALGAAGSGLLADVFGARTVIVWCGALTLLSALACRRTLSGRPLSQRPAASSGGSDTHMPPRGRDPGD